MFGHGLRTSRSNVEHSVRAACRGPIQRARMAVAVRTQIGSPGKGCGKAAPCKPKGRVPTALGNPAKDAGFPLSHSRDGGGPSTLKKADISCATKTGHFNLLTTALFMGILSLGHRPAGTLA